MANLPLPYVIGPRTALCACGIIAPCSRQMTPLVDAITRLVPCRPPTARKRPSPKAIPPKGNGPATAGYGAPAGTAASISTLVQSAPLVEASMVQADPAPLVPTTNTPSP